MSILVPAKKAISKKKPATQSAPVESENMSILATLRSEGMNTTNRLNEVRGKFKKHPMSSTYGPKEVYRYANLKQF